MKSQMTRLRHALVIISVAVLTFLGTGMAANSAELGTLRMGVLKFGTVNWELAIIQHYGLDKANGFTLEIQPFGRGDAANVALLGGAVDGIVDDWLWVSRMRHDGTPITMIPYSSAVGSLIVRPESGIVQFADLAGQKLGIAGGPLDKSWLIMQAVAQQREGIDLATIVEPVFAAPPLLQEQFTSGELAAVLTYWHYSARLEAQGYQRLLDVKMAQVMLGAPANTPQLGYSFMEAFADANPELIQAFAKASRAAKRLMEHEDEAWEFLSPLTQAGDEATLETLRIRLAEGMVWRWGEPERRAAKTLYGVLAELGGTDLVGQSPVLMEGTFWDGVRY